MHHCYLSSYISKHIQLVHEILQILLLRYLYRRIWILHFASHSYYLDTPIVGLVFDFLLLFFRPFNQMNQRGSLTLFLLWLDLLAAGLFTFWINSYFVRVKEICLSIVRKTIRKWTKIKKVLQDSLTEKTCNNTHSCRQTGSTNSLSLYGSFCPLRNS